MASCSDVWETNSDYDNMSKALEAINGKLKESLKHLEASEEPLQAEKSALSKTLAEVQEKCLSQSDWQQKYTIQKGLKDTLQTEIEKAAEDITFFQDKLRAQDEFEAEYKSMKALKKVASKQNNNLRKHLNDVQKKCGSEHTLQGKISAVQEENQDSPKPESRATRSDQNSHRHARFVRFPESRKQRHDTVGGEPSGRPPKDHKGSEEESPGGKETRRHITADPHL
ncbi:hypothetical protein KUCAC02_010201 [Chaenocephalus aceratus]|uniref:Uncharacterized protein n=1 Tax=Chaenocephalus aceratus TaxID=36190 RepID=A0ACB9VZ48_CHAAC|nr:hypothetical protein KUCAC02_010201 [Chaenocephalus aceratus]